MEGWAVLRGACLDDELGGVGFNFWSEVEVGTELQLTVPGAIAYKVSVRGMDSGGSASRKFPKHRCCTDPPPTVFVRDALSNPEHIKFALKGCLAASPCYIINLEEFKIQTALRLQIVWHFSQDAWRRFSLSRTTENLTSSLEKELRESQAPVVHADLPAGPNHSGV